MKKILLTVLAVLGFVLAANAESFGTFTITVNTPATIAIALRNVGDTGTYGAWAVGSLSLSASSTMITDQAVLVKNTSNVPVNLTAKASNTAAWSVGASAGSSVYAIALAANAALASVGVPATALSTSDVTIASSIAVGTNQFVLAKLSAPTASTTGIQQEITVTITAAQ